MANEYHVTSTRTVSEEEARRRLARVYSLLIDLANEKRTADREEFADPDRPADGNTTPDQGMMQPEDTLR